MNILHHNFQYDYHNKKILPFNFVTCAVLDNHFQMFTFKVYFKKNAF